MAWWQENLFSTRTITMEIERIARLLEKTFERQPWYGSSVMEILKDIDENIVDKAIGQTHCISQLVQHMIAWRTFTTKRLQGDGDFEVTEQFNFPKSESWEKTQIQLIESQRSLLEAVKNFPEARLGEIVPSKEYKYTYYSLLHGIIQHDVYHLGQIALLKKALIA
jgi:uncharacterized damage-inducible protein DinB